MHYSSEIGISSVSNPINFFKSFFDANTLSLLHKEFFAELKDPESWIQKYPHRIDMDNEKYSIEYENQIYQDEIKDVPGYEYSLVEEKTWIEKVYYFKDFLNIRFKEEFLRSCDFIDQSLNKQIPIEHAKHLCHLWISKLLYYINISKRDKFKRYNECARPLEAVIRYLLEKYSSFCPPLISNIELQKIKEKSWKGIEGPNKKILKSSIYKALVEFQDEDENDLFEYKDFKDEIEVNKKIHSLQLLCNGEFLKVTEPLITNWSVEPVHYILRKLKEHSKKLLLKDLEQFQPIVIRDKNSKDKKFTATASSVAATRFEEKEKNTELKNLIDTLFDEHVM